MWLLEVMKSAIVFVAIGVWILSMLLACARHTGQLPKGRELIHQASPTNLAKAFVWMPELGDLGATVSQPYEVWVEGLQPVGKARMVFEADKTDGLRIRWISPTSLEICYSAAQITSFNNFYVSATEESQTVLNVDIVLRKASSLADCLN
jgi:hypothetical protein